MNIDVSKEEYEKLIDLLYIASIVVTGNKTRDTPVTQPYEAVVQKFYALAVQMGQSERVAYDFDLDAFLPTKKLEDSSTARSLLDEFTDESFWHELIGRLTERDLERQAGGAGKPDALSPDERFELETPIEERYLEEFERNGIERLQIVEDFSLPREKPRTSD
jgi:hypothetical protein